MEGCALTEVTALSREGKETKNREESTPYVLSTHKHDLLYAYLANRLSFPLGKSD